MDYIAIAIVIFAVVVGVVLELCDTAQQIKLLRRRK